VPYLNASAVVYHYEEALYQVHALPPLPLGYKPTARNGRQKLDDIMATSFGQLGDRSNDNWTTCRLRTTNRLRATADATFKDRDCFL